MSTQLALTGRRARPLLSKGRWMEPAGGFRVHVFTKVFAGANNFDPRANVGIKYQRRSGERWGYTWDFEWDGLVETVDDGLCSGFLMVASLDGTDGRFAGRAISEYPNLEMCSEWLRDCSVEHEGCDSFRDSLLPTRLLDVEASGSPDKLRLVETKGQYGQYVTLSHCWGGHNPPVTDSKSYWRYLRGIPLGSLPRTFRDAVKITRQLGVQYLWIDCFCIVQGDEADWQRECASMDRIFANSRVTIAGPAAGNPDAGLLHPRPCRTVSPCNILRSATKRNKTFDLHVSLPARQDWSYNAPVERNSPLANRAWIVQERFLSPRILYFGSDQLYYECNTVTNFECFRQPIEFKDTGDTGDPARAALTKGTLSFVAEFFEDVEADREILYETWYTLISTYSACNLTEPRDKLPALSGLAKRFADRNQDMYLAGLWRRDLLKGLTWCPRFFFRRRSAYVDYVGPSWSWISFNGPVAWPFAEIQKGMVHVTDGRFPSQPVSFLDSRCDVDVLDPYGRVLSGRLKLVALTKTFIVETKDPDIDGHQIRLHDPTCHPHGDTLMYLDQLTGVEYLDIYGAYAYCVLLGFWRRVVDSRRTKYGWIALAVSLESNRNGHYSRLGLVVNTDAVDDIPTNGKWYKSPWVSAQQESLTLV